MKYLVRIGGATLVAVCLTLVMSASSGATTLGRGLVQLSGTSHSTFTNPCATTAVVPTTGKTYVTLASLGKVTTVGWLDQEHGDGYGVTQVGGTLVRTASTTYTFQGQAFFTNFSNPRLDFGWAVDVTLHVTTAATDAFTMHWTETHGVCFATGHTVGDPQSGGGA